MVRLADFIRAVGLVREGHCPQCTNRIGIGSAITTVDVVRADGSTMTMRLHHGCTRGAVQALQRQGIHLRSIPPGSGAAAAGVAAPEAAR